MRDAWERTRFLATAMLQPYSKRQLRPTDVLRFEWDSHEPDVAPKPSTRERFEEMANRIGLDASTRG